MDLLDYQLFISLLLSTGAQVEKRAHFSFLYIFFLNKMLHILGMCDIEKKDCVSIDNDRQYFADCVIVLIS